MLAYIKELRDTRELLINLTMRQVKGQYRRTFLGQLWSFINPLSTMLVYTIVFHLLFRAAPPPGNPSGIDIYAIWLMCGLLPWRFFTSTVTGVMSSITGGSGNLIKKVYFPRLNLPFASVGAGGYDFMNEIGILVLALFLVGGSPFVWLPIVALYMILLGMFAAGIGMILAIINIHFRDTEHFVQIALRLGMYLTPVMYPVSVIQTLASKDGGWILKVFQANPMFHFIGVFRNLLYDNRMPSFDDMGMAALAAVITFVIGCIVFVKNEKGLALLL